MTQRRWMILVATGFAMVMVAIIVVCLVIIAKAQFQWLVGSAFLGSIVGLVLLGGLLMLVATFMLPDRWSWRSILVIVWSLIAVTSPLFGIMFLMPWAVLLFASPFVVMVLWQWFRAPVAAAVTESAARSA